MGDFVNRSALDHDTGLRPVRPARGRAAGIAAALGHRWPTWLALAFVVLNFWGGETELEPFAWPLLALPGLYVLIGVLRGELRTPGALAVQLAALFFYAVLVLLAFAAGGDTARYLVAAGWLGHAVWDYVHHRTGKVVPRAYAEWCMVVDPLIAAGIILWV